jgi:folate-binding Fe-S cluster repair protein YgfZ
MIIIVGIFILALISLFIYIVMRIWKKLRQMIIGVRMGSLQNQIVSKIIKKALTTAKIEYTIYRPITGSMIFSFIYLFIKYITDTYFLDIKLKGSDFLFTFIFMFVVWSVVGIIVSYKIWYLCRQE